MLELRTYAQCVDPPTRKKLILDENVQVLFNTDSIQSNRIKPYPTNVKDIWDGNHVRMPYISMNKLKSPKSKEGTIYGVFFFFFTGSVYNT